MLGALNLMVSLLALGAGGTAIALHLLDDPAPAPGPSPEAATGSTAPSSDVPSVVARCLPSVVNISTTRMVDSPLATLPLLSDPIIRQFFGLGEPAQHEAHSLGSGVIVSADGVVVTNHHVIENATEIKVTLHDGRELDARLVGSDPESDVAVLRLAGESLGLRPLPYGDSSELRLGEEVLAIGNPFGVGQTVTLGIVSAVGRASMGITDYEDFIQTDAAINPGNSGGALVSLRGELVGINTAILSRTGGSHGIGFAIPSNMAQPIVTALLRDGRVTRGWLGVSIQDLTPELARSLGMRETSGVVVMEVDPQGPAAGADLRRGDRVVRLDDETIGSSRQLRNLVATRGAGVAVRLTRVREGQSAAVPITLRERPARTATSTITDADATEVRGMRLVTLDEGARRQFNVQDDVRAGAVVVSVTSDRPQGLGGDLRPGDVITEVNTQPVSTPAEVRQAIERSFLVTFLTVRRGAESLRVILPP